MAARPGFRPDAMRRLESNPFRRNRFARRIGARADHACRVGAPVTATHRALQQTGHPSPGALGVDRPGPKAQAAVGASSAVMSITAGSSSGTSTSGLTLMLRCRSKPVPAGMMWPMMTFSLKPRR